jgi:ubiquinol-cytochrome c reductase cytochrome c subunit
VRKKQTQTRTRTQRRRLAASAVLAVAAAAIALAPSSSGQQPPASASASASIGQGRQLFLQSCSSCHGFDARGVKNRGPSLHGVGARAADFYLSTGRMPLDDPRDQPLRREPAFNRQKIDALVAYVGSLGGPPIPRADPSKGSISEGFEQFGDKCAGCHQIVGQGGMVTGARVPALQHASPTEIAEAVRIGPYLMPKFSETRLNQHQLDSVVRYIQYTQAPDDEGGWAIGHVGPIPEGMVAWFLGLLSLILFIRVIGERTPE